MDELQVVDAEVMDELQVVDEDPEPAALRDLQARPKMVHMKHQSTRMHVQSLMPINAWFVQMGAWCMDQAPQTPPSRPSGMSEETPELEVPAALTPGRDIPNEAT